jgi:hypothetical protein
VADKVQSALKKLQAEARKKSGSDGLGFAIWNVPEDLAAEDCVQIVLDGAGMKAMEQAKAEVLKDQRFDYFCSLRCTCTSLLPTIRRTAPPAGDVGEPRPTCRDQGKLVKRTDVGLSSR